MTITGWRGTLGASSLAQWSHPFGVIAVCPDIRKPGWSGGRWVNHSNANDSQDHESWEWFLESFFLRLVDASDALAVEGMQATKFSVRGRHAKARPLK